MSTFNHICLDLETLGLEPGRVLRSIGAVRFNLSGEIGDTFYRNIDKDSCLDAGLTIDPATAQWWARQSPQARAALEVDPRPLAEVIGDFNIWFGVRSETRVWAQGAAFDPAMWEAAVKAAGYVVVPWKFHALRDTRTIYDVFNFDIRDVPRDGVYHSALDDALYQVRCVVTALSKGRPGFAYAAQWAEATPEPAEEDAFS
jgi:hypothetical protein